jgi:hypothetical protein
MDTYSRLIAAVSMRRAALCSPYRFQYTITMEDIRYPIGKFTPEKEINAEKRAFLIRRIAELPDRLEKALRGLGSEQLYTPYRDGGWTPCQLAHHIADAHMNGFIRFKFGLLEDTPLVRPYNEEDWAKTKDAKVADPALSLSIIRGLHGRWTALLSSLSAADFSRTINHPDRGVITLDYNLQLYSWHGTHHTAQIEQLRARKGW